MKTFDAKKLSLFFSLNYLLSYFGVARHIGNWWDVLVAGFCDCMMFLVFFLLFYFYYIFFNMRTQKDKLWQKVKHSNCDKTKKITLWQNSKSQIVTKFKHSYCDKTQKLKVWQNSKTQIVTKFKKSNCDKNQKIKLWQKSKTQIVTKPFLKLWQN